MSRFGQWTNRRAQHLAKTLFESVRAEPPTRGGGRPLAWAVMFFAGLVHAVTVALVSVAILLVAVVPGLLPIRIIAALFLLAIAYFVQPLHRSKAAPVRVGRQEAPELFGLLDEIAAAVKAPRVECVELGPEFNAHFTEKKRRPTLGLGLSLWSVLDGQEKVALLGHELAHGVNGDVRNGRFVGTALYSLARWRQLLAPDRGGSWSRRGSRGGQGLVTLAERVIMPLLLIPVVAVIGAFGRMLQVLSSRHGQRREYYADDLAVMVGGSSAAISLTRKLLISDICTQAVIQAVRFGRGGAPWSRVREAAASVPASEWERLHRLGERRLSRIDDSHPPTVLRAKLMQSRPETTALVALGPDREARIEAELVPARERLGARLAEALGVASQLRS